MLPTAPQCPTTAARTSRPAEHMCSASTFQSKVYLAVPGRDVPAFKSLQLSVDQIGLKAESLVTAVLTSLPGGWTVSKVRRSSPEQRCVNVWTAHATSRGQRREHRLLLSCTCSVTESSETHSYHRPPSTDSTFLPLLPPLPVPLLRSPPLTHQCAFTQSRRTLPPLCQLSLHHPEVPTPDSSPPHT